MTVKKENDNRKYILSKHAKQRLQDRGINVGRFLKKDLDIINATRIINMENEHKQIRYTKSNLKIIICTDTNVVITVMKCRQSEIFGDMMKYGYK